MKHLLLFLIFFIITLEFSASASPTTICGSLWVKKIHQDVDRTIYQMLRDNSGLEDLFADNASVQQIFEAHVGDRACVTGVYDEVFGDLHVQSVEVKGGDQQCPDLTGVYGNLSNLGLAFEFRQNGCHDLTMIQYHKDETITDQIFFDGQFRPLNAMPKLEALFAFDGTHIIGLMNDVNTHLKDRNMFLYLDDQKNLIVETVKFDNRGYQTSDSSVAILACPESESCL